MNKWIRHTYKLLEKIAFFLIYLGQSARMRLRRLPKNRKSMVFTLDQEGLYTANDGLGRYAYLMLRSLSDGEYNIYLIKDVDTHKKYMGLCKYGRLIYSIKNLKIVTKVPAHLRTDRMIYAFDSIDHDILSYKWKKLIYVNILWPTFCRMGEMIWKPYYFHPLAYYKGIDKKIQQLRRNTRNLKIFFAGNAVPGCYSQSKIKDRYNKLTRHEGSTAALELTGKVKVVNDSDEFLRIVNKEPYLNECHLLQTNRSVRLKIEKYWYILSKSDFFLCLSGTDVPQCHNVIEAMSVGTIPIIEYDDWFFPALKDGTNAIVFFGKQDLKAKILKVLSMNQDEILKMRKNVIDYYEKHLSDRSFVSNIEHNKDPIATIMQHPHLVCSPKENKIGEKFIVNMKAALKNILSENRKEKHETAC